MNKGNFWGFLSKDPAELQRFGDKVKGRIIVAVRRHIRGKDGHFQSDFIPVVTWGATAESCFKYLHKGSPVAVEYHLQSGQYDDAEGKRHFTLDVVADSIDFLPTGKTDQPRTSDESDPGGEFLPVDEETPF